MVGRREGGWLLAAYGHVLWPGGDGGGVALSAAVRGEEGVNADHPGCRMPPASAPAALRCGSCLDPLPRPRSRRPLRRHLPDLFARLRSAWRHFSIHFTPERQRAAAPLSLAPAGQPSAAGPTGDRQSSGRPLRPDAERDSGQSDLDSCLEDIMTHEIEPANRPIPRRKLSKRF